MIKVKDLADLVIDKSRAGEMLFCKNCEAEYSASSGDYFFMSPEEVFKCGCGELLNLAIRQQGIKILK